MSGCSLPSEHHANGPPYDLEIQEDRPALNVIEIYGKHLRERDLAARPNLVKASNPRFDPEAPFGPVVIELKLKQNWRPRPDKAHIAFEDIDQLWDLVETESSEDPAYWRDPRIRQNFKAAPRVWSIMNDELAEPLFVMAVVTSNHAPEFVVRELTPVLSHDTSSI